MLLKKVLLINIINIFLFQIFMFSSNNIKSTNKLQMLVLFANDNNFNKFLLLTNKNKGKKEIGYEEYFNFTYECKIIRENEDSVVAFTVDKILNDKIQEDIKKNIKLCLQQNEKISNYVFFKVSSFYKDENKNEEDQNKEYQKRISEGISPFKILVNIPNNLYPTSTSDIISYICEDNETSKYVFDIQDFLNNNKDNLTFVMDENGLIWTFKKIVNGNKLSK